MSVLGLRGLRGRFLLLVVCIYVLVGAASLFAFYQVADSIIHRLGAGYATQFASQQRGRILAKIERELVLAQKLVDSPLLKDWALHEDDARLKRDSLAELESYRRLFSDHSWFFIIDASHNYYFNNASNEFAGNELRYVVKPDDPTTSWYFATLAHVDDFDLHVDNSEQLGVTKIWINVIVKDAAGRKIGLGGSGLDFSAFLKEAVRSNDPGVETVLVDADGFVKAQSDSQRMEDNAHIRDESKRLTVDKLIDREPERERLHAMLASMQQGGAPDQQLSLTIGGRERIVAVSYLPEIHWVVLALVDPGQVIRLKTFQPIVFLMGAALLLSVLLVSWLLERLVLNRLARLTGLTRDIAAGRYDRTLAVDREDEIGQLTRSFNTMTTTIGDYMQNLEDKVADRTAELREANTLLAASNRKVMDSIEYARLIQSSILAKPEDLAALLPAHAVLWRPRDIVGGDFYCLYRDAQGGFLVALADCTGHGVPGAFMTMASKALLDHAVAMRGAEDPAAVIGELHRGLRALLQRRDAAEADHGLDIALVHVPAARDRLVFAGAKLPLWVLRADGSFEAVRGDRSSVGYRKTADDVVYANHALAAGPGDRYVLLSDGILDQNGGERGFGFGHARLRDVLAAFGRRPLAQLPEALDAALAAWQGGLPQRDDITLLAFNLDGETAPSHGGMP